MPYFMPYAKVCIVLSDHGICSLHPIRLNEDLQNVISDMECHLNRFFPQATYIEDSAFVNQFMHQYSFADYPLDLKGSEFQVQVWQALRRIPVGQTVSYQDVAHAIGRPSAVRAVATAIARNSIFYLVPCHRVIRKTGQVHFFRWGQDLKQQLLEIEECII